MPVVPSSNGQQVGPAPLPGLRVNVETFGGGPAATPVDLSGIARVATNIYRDEKQKADQIAVDGGQADLSGWETDALHNADTGALNMHGEQAFSLPEQVAESFQQRAADIRSRLTNDTQRAQFDRIAAAHWDSINGQVQTHVANERKAYDGQQSNALINNESAAAIANYDDPARVSAALGNTVGAIERYGQRNGLSPDVVQEQKDAATTRIHLGVISRLIANDQFDAAKQWHDQFTSEITGPGAIEADKAVKLGSARGESQQQADAILQSAATLTDAVQRARAITDPEVRDMTEARVRSDFAEKQKADRDDEEQRMLRATNIVEQTHNAQRVPPSDWLKLPLQAREALDSYASQLQGGGKVETDWSTYYSLQSMATNDATRPTFINRNLMIDRPRLADAQFSKLVDLQGELRGNDQKAQDKLSGIRTREQIVDGAVHAIGLGENPKRKGQDAPLIDTIKRSVDVQVEQEEARTGKPASSADVQQIVDDIVTQHVVQSPGRWWGTNTTTKRLYEVQPEDQLILSPKDIPTTERRALTASMRARGLPVTDESLVKQYRDYLNSLVRRGPR